MAKKPLTRKEKLVNSLNLRKSNLEKKLVRLTEEFKEAEGKVKEEIEVIKLQLSGLEK